MHARCTHKVRKTCSVSVKVSATAVACAPAPRQAVQLADVRKGHDQEHHRHRARREHGDPQVAQHVHRVAAYQRFDLRTSRM